MILIVDDDPVSVLVSQHILSNAEHAVLTASDAGEAAALLADPEHKIALVICDVQMPGESGLDLLERERGRAPDGPPFVMLTGVGNASQLNDERVELAAGFITKPVASADLIDVVERLLSSD